MLIYKNKLKIFKINYNAKLKFFSKILNIDFNNFKKLTF